MPTPSVTPKNKLRIVFMGTPEFAVAGLNALLNEDYEIVGVITAPDKPAGRGRKIHESAIKRHAVEKGLTLLQPTNLKDPGFLEHLAALNGNLFIVVAFRMLPQQVWEMPQYGTFNLHASLLPQYRGAAPINWAIINGETKTGVTTFLIDDKIDTGNILLQAETGIGQNETAGELHDRLQLLGAQLILKTVQAIAAGTVDPMAQPERSTLKPAPKIHKENCKIDWEAGLDRIYDHIRGLSPYPTAWTTLIDGDRQLFIKIYQASKEMVEHQQAVGKVIADKRSVKVAVEGGYMVLEKIQLPGKKAMLVQEVLNGLRLSSDAHMR